MIVLIQPPLAFFSIEVALLPSISRKLIVTDEPDWVIITGVVQASFDWTPLRLIAVSLAVPFILMRLTGAAKAREGKRRRAHRIVTARLFMSP